MECEGKEDSAGQPDLPSLFWKSHILFASCTSRTQPSMHQKTWSPQSVAALFQVFQAHYQLTNTADGSAAAQAVCGDAVAVANMMVASFTYTATIKAGSGGATLGLLRRSQLTSLMSQVHSTPVIAAWILDSGPIAGPCIAC